MCELANITKKVILERRFSNGILTMQEALDNKEFPDDDYGGKNDDV